MADKAYFEGKKWSGCPNGNPRAKTAAVQILSISNVPSDVLDAIDDLAAGQDRSRSSFVRRELQRIVAVYQAEAA